MSSKLIKAVIVDDEAHARALIAEYLEDFPEIQVTAAFANGLEAARGTETAQADLLFLDVEMPGMNGFQLLEVLGARAPHVIFSTAYNQHAVRAFEVAALDYLLKPYDRVRFAQAMVRAQARIAEKPPRVEEVSHRRLLVHGPRGIVPLSVEDIIWIEAAGDYCMIHQVSGALLCARGLGSLAERLPTERFSRVHRSAIINLDKLQRLEKDGEGGMIAHMLGGADVRVSRGKAARLREMVL